MVKNRKPMFVSSDAHKLLKEKAITNKRFIGDEVDIMLGIKTPDVIQEENKQYFKEISNDNATI